MGPPPGSLVAVGPLAVTSALALVLIFAFIRLGRERSPGRDGAGARFAGFNALRAAAALGVLASHVLATSAVPMLPGLVVRNLATGVALFFVISGFLLYRPFALSLVSGGPVSIRNFGLNRGLASCRSTSLSW